MMKQSSPPKDVHQMEQQAESSSQSNQQKKRSLPTEEPSNEAEIMQELQKLERPGTAGIAGIPAKKRNFNLETTIATGISESPQQVAKIVRGTIKQNVESLKQELIVIGGNSRLHYPDVKISGASEEEKLKDVSKYFSMIIPTQMTPSSQNVKYFLRKGVEKTDNESMVELSEESFKKMCETGMKIFFPFFKRVNGVKVSNPEDLPIRPENVILEDYPAKKEKLVLRVDDFDFDFGGRKTKYMPNVSIRIWRQGRNGWFRTLQGVTMSSYNFYYFIMATAKFFVPAVKTIFEGVQEGLKEYVEEYADGDDEEFSNQADAVEEPFPN